MSTKLYTVTTTPYAQALILKSILETDGIRCILSNVNVVRPSLSQYVELKVSESDTERAMLLVREFETERVDKIYFPDKSGIDIILVPVDFSLPSKNAALYAVKLAEKFASSEIRFLYVYYAPDPANMAFSETFVYQGDVTNQLGNIKKESEATLKDFINELKAELPWQTAKKIKFSAAIEPGITADAILTYSRQLNPQLIVMGASGMDRRKEMFGSSAIRVLLKARFPVLVIPEDLKFDNEKGKLKIVYATNFDEYDFFAISRLISLFSIFELFVYCIHVGRGDHTLEKMKMEALKEYFRKGYPELMLSCSISEDDCIEDSLNEFVSAKEIDMIVLTTRRRNLLTSIIQPSITKKVFCKTSLPLMAFHARH